MNSAIKDDVKKIKKLILEEDLIVEYLILKRKIENSRELENLKNEVKFYKKCSMTEEEREEYFKAKKALENNPLFSNYENIKKDVEEFKKEIKSILEL